LTSRQIQNAVFVDQVEYTTKSKQKILRDLFEHVTNTYIRVSYLSKGGTIDADTEHENSLGRITMCRTRGYLRDLELAVCCVPTFTDTWSEAL
jgi:hypothetical protein